MEQAFIKRLCWCLKHVIFLIIEELVMKKNYLKKVIKVLPYKTKVLIKYFSFQETLLNYT